MEGEVAQIIEFYLNRIKRKIKLQLF
jgi:hypothetical protein